MTQQTLFDLGSETGFYGQPIEPKQIARSTDPETSKQAAVSVNLEGNCKLFYDALAASDSPLTAQEIAADAVPIDGSIPVASALWSSQRN